MKRTTTIAVLLLFAAALSAQENWKIYTEAELGTSMLRTGNITSNLCEDAAGNMWISNASGSVLKYTNENFEIFKPEHINVFGQSSLGALINLKTGIVADWKISVDNNGSWVWFAGPKGLVLWDGLSMYEFGGDKDEEGRMIFIEEKSRKNYIIQDNLMTETSASSSGSNPIIQISASYLDSNNNLWLGDWFGKIYKVSEGRVESFTDLSEGNIREMAKWQPRWINQIFEDSKGSIWILGNSFIAEYDRGVINVIRSVANPEAIFEDSRKNIWVAHLNGVLQYSGGMWDDFKRDEDKGMVYREYVSRFMEGSDGTLWFSSSVHLATRKGGGLYKFDGNEWKNQKLGKYHSYLLEDSKGNLWATDIRNLYKFESGKWSTKNTAEGFAVFYLELYEDSKGDIWIACSTVKGHLERFTPN